jgi:hypothetical protein
VRRAWWERFTFAGERAAKSTWVKGAHARASTRAHCTPMGQARAYGAAFGRNCANVSVGLVSYPRRPVPALKASYPAASSSSRAAAWRLPILRSCAIAAK